MAADNSGTSNKPKGTTTKRPRSGPARAASRPRTGPGRGKATKDLTGGQATSKTKPRKPRKPAPPRFRPAAPEDFAEVERAMEVERQRRDGAGSAAQRVERDDAVIAGLAMGLTPTTVARRTGLTRNHVDAIIAAERERYTTGAPRGQSVLWDALRALESNIEQTAMMVTPQDGEERPPVNVRLAGVKLKHELQTARLELLLAMGLISASPASYEREREARDYMLRFVQGLRDSGVDEAVIEQVAASAMPVDVAADTRNAARPTGAGRRPLAA